MSDAKPYAYGGSKYLETPAYGQKRLFDRETGKPIDYAAQEELLNAAREQHKQTAKLLEELMQLLDVEITGEFQGQLMTDKRIYIDDTIEQRLKVASGQRFAGDPIPAPTPTGSNDIGSDDDVPF